jgi:metal-dependent amidase/aminoacylase/carboxypeptidase family protein
MTLSDYNQGIGHACGHNLIAIAGVGVALAVRHAIEVHGISGTVVLLGTPGQDSKSLSQIALGSCFCSRGGGARQSEAH